MEDIKTKVSSALDKFNCKDYLKSSIGTFLNAIDVEIGEDILNKIYETKADGSFGTFVYKRELSELVLKKAYENKITWADFKENPHIETLTKGIYDFIVHSKN